ncbi:MAG: trigger factor [Synechococcus sp.]|nr:trigger factor [Synechococcus sp.]
MSPAAASPSQAEIPAAGADAPALRVSPSPRPAGRLALELAVPGSQSLAGYEAAVGRLSRNVKLPGFRKGRVPRPVLLQQLGPLRVRATALEELIENCFRQAVAQEGIKPLSQPELGEDFEVLLARFEPGQELVFSLEFDIEPSPSLKATRGLSAVVEPVNFDPAEVEKQLEQARRQLATLVPVEDRAAERGDVAEVSFEGRFSDSGEAIEGGSSDGMEVELEEGRMIPGFVEGILGMHPGESRTISCRFPASYPNAGAADREAEFALRLIELKTRELPALDDAFAQQASDRQTLAELRSELETRLRAQADQRQRSNRRAALLDALVEQLEVELPETLIQSEIRDLLEETADQMARQGVDVRKVFTAELVRGLRETSRTAAEQRLRQQLALQALAAAESISISEAAVETRLREVRRELGENSRVDPDLVRSSVRRELLQDALFEWLEAHSSLSDKPAAEPAGDGPDAVAADAAGATEPAQASEEPID